MDEWVGFWDDGRPKILGISLCVKRVSVIHNEPLSSLSKFMLMR